MNSLRATAISTFSLTTSIISSFALMYVLGYTINYMTLLALTLSVGLLIDDAIVIIENIYRKLGKGEKKNRKKAVEKASDEISLAVTATTLTIVAVFLPVAFMPGIIGQYFLQFGITVSFAVLVSLFVAFTYTPMMASRWLKPQPKSLKESRMLNRLAWKFNHGFKFFTKGYLRVLEWALFHKKIMMLLAGGIMALTLYFFKQLGSEFAPITDVGQFIMRVSLDPGASLEETSATVWKIEQDIARNPQVKKIFTSVGGGDHPVTHAEITVIMVDKSEREKSIREIENEYRQKFKDLPGVQLSFLGGIGSNDEQKPIEYHIKGENIDTLERIANEFILRLKQIDGIVDLHKDVQNSQPEYRVFVDRDKASIFGLSPFGVGSAIRTALSGTVAAEFDVKDERIDVLVQVDPALAQNMDELLRVKTRAGVPDKSGNFPLIPLSELTKVEKAFTLSQINRYDHQNSIEVSANLYGLLSGDALALIKEQIPLLNLPQGYEITVGGQTESQEQSMVAFVAVMLFSILFVYMILASLFRSYSQPFIIMFSLPLALLGACLGLIIAGSSLSIMAMIGLVMLLGLVTKNAILLVNYANQMQRKENKSCLEALLLAGKVRLKPIMMTSLAMIFGMIPIAFSVSEGSSFRAPMGQAVMGGLISSTIFTLLFIPVLYMMLDNFLNRKKQKADRQ
ncbi:MAG: efflux RND transporter permease subunit [Cytophagales bacterium]|nr:efflux RND transporter permease subunit [Cytophagales bacterium]